MKCEVCGSDVDKRWEFCPKCGSRVKKMPLFGFGPLGLEDIFKSFGKEMERVEKDLSGMEKDFSVIDLRSLFPKGIKPGARGFTIKISTQTGEKPRIDVKTFGDVEKGQLEKEVAKQLGVNPEEVKIAEERIAVPTAPGAAETKPRVPKMFFKRPSIAPTITEEPKTKITQMPGKVIVEVEVPGVKREEDVEIRELNESAEVKAVAKDRVYFKILTLPPELTLVRKELKNEKLIIEFGYE